MTALSLFDLSGKKALVTGGAMGIGRAAATALAMGGADVAIVDLNEDMGKKTVELLKTKARDAFFVRCDVSDKTQVQAMMAEIIKRFGRLDIAVNNAGIIGSGEPDEIQPQDNWDKVIAVNLTGVWLCAQAQAQQMIKQQPTEGKIINTASVAATTACADGAYSAAKAGVVHLTRSLAARWGRFNINVNCFSPGCVMSPLMASMPLDTRQRIREMTPLGHLQRPEDIAGAVLFFASNASNFVTGQNLQIDGGLTLDSLSFATQPRDISPRISPKEEVMAMKKDLDALNIPYDEQGVRLV